MYGQNKEYTLKGTLETRTSNKTGREYQCLVLKLGTYDKVVFLDKAEIELLKNNVK